MKYHTNKATASILQYRHPVIENAKANLPDYRLCLLYCTISLLLGQTRPAPPPSSVHDPIETDNKINIHKQPKAPTNSDIIPPFLLIVLHTVVHHKDR